VDGPVVCAIISRTSALQAAGVADTCMHMYTRARAQRGCRAPAALLHRANARCVLPLRMPAEQQACACACSMRRWLRPAPPRSARNRAVRRTSHFHSSALQGADSVAASSRHTASSARRVAVRSITTASVRLSACGLLLAVQRRERTIAQVRPLRFERSQAAVARPPAIKHWPHCKTLQEADGCLLDGSEGAERPFSRSRVLMAGT
jgi:hypothetical protein